MKRRDWLLGLGMGLCSSLLPACIHTQEETALDPPPVAVAPPEESRQLAAAAGSGSPYQPLSPNPLRLARKHDNKVEQVEYPGAAGSGDTPPEPEPAPVERERSAKVPAGNAGSAGSLHPPLATGSRCPVSPDSRLPLASDSRPVVAGGALDLPEADPGKQSLPPLLAALRCFLEKRPGEALDILGRFDKPNQDLLVCLLPLAARLAEGNLQQANGQELAILLEQFHGLLTPLRTRAALVIDKICFCSQIDTFGVYEPLPDDYRFQSGERVQVYVELGNFSSEKHELPSGQTRFVTRLASSAEIRDYHGKKVWPSGNKPLAFRQKPDISRSPRQDYFNRCQFSVPDLPPGDYTLWIYVEDLPTKRTVQRSLDFRLTTNAAGPGS